MNVVCLKDNCFIFNFKVNIRVLHKTNSPYIFKITEKSSHYIFRKRKHNIPKMLTLEYGALITAHQRALFLIEDVLAKSSVPGTVNIHCFHQPFILEHGVTKTKGCLFKS